LPSRSVTMQSLFLRGRRSQYWFITPCQAIYLAPDVRRFEV
jgi:hypothetical protein